MSLASNGQENIARTSDTVSTVRSGRLLSTMIAPSRNGKPRTTSVSREIRLSTQPPRVPAITPSTTATTSASTVVSTPTAIDDCVP